MCILLKCPCAVHVLLEYEFLKIGNLKCPHFATFPHAVIASPSLSVLVFGSNVCFYIGPGVTQGPQIILTGVFQSRHDSSSGCTSVKMFTLCSDPALRPRDIFLTYWKENFLLEVEVLKDHVLSVTYIFGH